MTTQQIAVDGQRLACVKSAGSGLPVVFVHGNSSSHETWRGLLEGLFAATLSGFLAEVR